MAELTMPHLAAIYIYPVKSLDPVSVVSARVLSSGALEGDRQFALFDAAGKFVNAKRFPRIQRLRSRFDVESRTLHLRLQEERVEHSWHVDEQRGSLEKWLSEFFELAVSFRENTEVGFPDDLEAAGPTVISTATYLEIASWMTGLTLPQLRMRFRANLEIGGVPAFWEDRLYREKPYRVPFRMGPVTLEGNNPCRRCAVPPRDPLTGEGAPGEFKTVFLKKRQETLPAWAERSRFDHFYRLSVNTLIAAAEAGKVLQLGDEVSVIASAGAGDREAADLSSATRVGSDGAPEQSAAVAETPA